MPLNLSDVAHQREWTRCKNGHEFTEENTYINPSNGHRRCRTCKSSARRVERIQAGHPDLREPRSLRVDLSWFTIDELANVDTTDVTWRLQAKCRTDNPSAEWTDNWFTGRGENQRVTMAARFCAACPVRLECLAAGLYERFGVFGGVTERQRRRLRPLVNERKEEAA